MSPGRDGPRGGGGGGAAARAWLAWWALMAAFYVVLTDSRRVEELVAAAVIGALGATAAALVRREREVVLLRPRAADVAAELRHVLRWPRDLALLAVALVRRPTGEVVETPFEATGSDPRDAGRRALAVAGRSLAPNTVVIAIDEERGVLQVHQLVPEDDTS